VGVGGALGVELEVALAVGAGCGDALVVEAGVGESVGCELGVALAPGVVVGLTSLMELLGTPELIPADEPPQPAAKQEQHNKAASAPKLMFALTELFRCQSATAAVSILTSLDDSTLSSY